MTNIKNALTRKFGPLPAWAWLSLFAVGVYYYRTKMSGSASVSGTGTGSVAPTGLQALQPGTSYYDSAVPGQFFTTPGSANPSGSGGSGSGKKKRKLPKLRGRGAIRAAGESHHKPVAPQGYHDVGLGGGFWEFLPNRKRRHNGKTGRGVKVPGRRLKGGSSHRTHHPRQAPDAVRHRRHRPRTRVNRPVKSRMPEFTGVTRAPAQMAARPHAPATNSAARSVRTQTKAIAPHHKPHKPRGKK